MRWGIEALFSDFKSRGFGLMQSQIKKPDRLERLILVMSIALYWAKRSQGSGDPKGRWKAQRRGSPAGPLLNNKPLTPA